MSTTTQLVRLWTQERDYAIVCEWWRVRSYPAIPANLLPQTGYVLEIDGAIVCAMFVYLTASQGIAHVKFIVGAPGHGMKEARENFRVLYDGVRLALKALDYHVIFVDCSDILAREVVKFGLTPCSSGNSFLIGTL